MTDRKKLAVAIERAKEQSEEYGLDRILVDFKAADMILELLKEQEPKEAKRGSVGGFACFVCGNCGVAITDGDKFCRMCGKAVKWNDI